MNRLTTTDGGTNALDPQLLESLAGSLRGRLLQPDHAEYDAERAIWNAMIDRRPGAIVQCAGPSDVLAAVRFARDHGLAVSVRGAGHNIAGNALADGALMVDLSRMTGVRVDPSARTVRVEPGCTLGDVDAETQAHALAVPTGINSTTGIAGLTLGGGFGWLSRKHGLTADNLLSADVVTADGELVRASADQNPDLFWGIRGGGGNFGVVTSFEFRCHPVGPEVLSGLIVHPFSDARGVLEAWRDFCATAPDELTVWMVARKAPPLPFLPPEVHGTEVVILAALHTGDMAEGERALEPLRAYGNPIADVIGPHTFVGFQAAFDPLLTPGMRNYWKSHNFAAVSDGVVDAVIDATGRLPSPHCEIFIAQMGGATSRIPVDATAYVGREAGFVMNVHGRWETPEEDDGVVGWARGLFNDLAPHAMGTAYVNFMPADETDRVEGAYGPNYHRLVELKARWDPENRFRFNQNIRPAAAGA